MQTSYPLFFALAFIAEVIGTISGFGSSIVFVPMAALFFDFKSVLIITALFHVFSNLSKIFLFRKGVEWKMVLQIGIPAVIAVSAGAMLTSLFATEKLELFMSIVLVILSVFLIIRFDRPFKRSTGQLIGGGLISGFLAGIAGSGGAVRGLVLSAFQLHKDAFIATSAFIDLGVDVSRSAIYLQQGYFRSDFWPLILGLVLVGFTGSYVGKRILQYTSEKVFRYVVLLVIIGTSCFQLYQSLHGMSTS
jgi:uncharacterized membrane protein YfcA